MGLRWQASAKEMTHVERHFSLTFFVFVSKTHQMNTVFLISYGTIGQPSLPLHPNA
jgi:hypothetical protein